VGRGRKSVKREGRRNRVTEGGKKEGRADPSFLFTTTLTKKKRRKKANPQ